MKNLIRLLTTTACITFGQEQTGPETGAAKQPDRQETTRIAVDAGTRVPLSMINSISTKGTVEGDRVYLETVYPVVSNGRIVIPAGSYVNGTVTQIKRA